MYPGQSGHGASPWLMMRSAVPFTFSIFSSHARYSGVLTSAATSSLIAAARRSGRSTPRGTRTAPRRRPVRSGSPIHAGRRAAVACSSAAFPTWRDRCDSAMWGRWSSLPSALQARGDLGDFLHAVVATNLPEPVISWM